MIITPTDTSNILAHGLLPALLLSLYELPGLLPLHQHHLAGLAPVEHAEVTVSTAQQLRAEGGRDELGGGGLASDHSGDGVPVEGRVGVTTQIAGFQTRLSIFFFFFWKDKHD